MDWRLVVLLVWGGGTIWAYGDVLINRFHVNRTHHDTRSRRELMSGISLFLTALASGIAIAFVLFGPGGTGVRAFAGALALGAFFGNGLVMRGEKHSEYRKRTGRRRA